MTPKEKANELVEKFIKHAKYWDCYNDRPLEDDHSKECALICVSNEYREKREFLYLLKSNGYDIPQYSKWLAKLINEEQEVKKEINKL